MMLKGRVAVVTGAGRGLGRAHALALAAEGAKVVVNDPDREVADAVVDEVRKAGGEAVPSYDSVATTEGAEAIIATCGTVDVLVNNAGILRDKTLLKMTDEMWDPVIDVHLRGTWACIRAAARVMKGGRIVNTTSVAGLKGNFGQSNYSAAKAGIYGLTLTAALELRKEGITVNAVAPLAKTRMTADIESIPDDFRPEHVSAVVVFLASDLAKDVTGRVIGVHGRRLFEYRMETTDGKEKKEDWTPSEIAEWIKTPAAPKEEPPGDVSGLFKALPSIFDEKKAVGWEAALHFAVGGAGDWTVEIKGGKLRVADGKPAAPTCVITVDAATLLGMADGSVNGQMAFMTGKLKATKVPDMAKFGKVFDFRRLNRGEEKPVSLVGKAYAGDAVLVRPEWIAEYDGCVGDAGSLIFPVSLIKGLFGKLFEDPAFTGDVSRMVHGEQVMTFHRPVAGWDVVSPRGRVAGIEEKSSGRVLSFEQKLWSEGELLVEMESRLFFRGESRGKKKAKATPPARGKPTSTQSVTVAADLPRRYAKASGDDNPIHVDDAFAKSVGFPGVILQGLCTLALAVRALPKGLERLQVRFARPVSPGDTLTTSVWKTGNELEFETATQAGDVVLSNGSATVRA